MCCHQKSIYCFHNHIFLWHILLSFQIICHIRIPAIHHSDIPCTINHSRFRHTCSTYHSDHSDFQILFKNFNYIFNKLYISYHYILMHINFIFSIAIIHAYIICSTHRISFTNCNNIYIISSRYRKPVNIKTTFFKILFIIYCNYKSNLFIIHLFLLISLFPIYFYISTSNIIHQLFFPFHIHQLVFPCNLHIFFFLLHSL